MSMKIVFAVGMIALSPIATAQSPKIVETPQAIVIKLGEQTVLTYNKTSPPVPNGIDKIYRRSGCLHPVVTPQGRTVTAMFPADHPHQHGIFSAWVKTTYEGRSVDFWNLGRGTGRVLHERVVSKSEKDGNAMFEVDLLHRAQSEPPVDILRERWKITVHPSEVTYHCFDLELKQTALTEKPLIIQKYHYGGFAVRGPTRWVSDKLPEDLQIQQEPSEFLNDLGSDRKQGNHQHAKWVALAGLIDGEPASIIVLNHPENFRSPQAARLHPKKPYFCFAPCVDGTFRIDQQHPYQARYRILVIDTKPDPEQVNKWWKAWASE